MRIALLISSEMGFLGEQTWIDPICQL